ncbi:MAG: hypothetical protein EHM58_19510 [Ignavibacteriae bacterium]|nr:MAG: hypothetical protein EHM58_19510 [Ignavibacteriota bacterium]
MKNTFILFFFALCFIVTFNLIGCKEDTPVVPPTTNDPGILQTDEIGNILGGDTTDWCIDYTGSGEMSFGPARPNPCGALFTVDYYVGTEDTVMIYLLRSSGDTVVFYKGNALPGQHAFTIDGTEFLNTYQRIYFKSEHYNSTAACRFYGDVKLEGK